MSEVTSPILTDATGQEIVSKLDTLLTKMDNLAAAFQPNASGIVYSNTTSGLTGDDVQEAIDEVAGDVSQINASLNDYIKVKYFTVQQSALTKDMDLSSYISLDSGYKFLCYQTLALSVGWVASNPIFVSTPTSPTGKPWWVSALTISGNVQFFYFEIKDV